MTLGAMTYDIKIGSRTLKGVTAVSISNSVESLSAIATIELPGYIANKPFLVENYIKRGDKVTISLGYKGENKQEFTGFVRAISTNIPVRIECEDEIFAFRKEVKSEVFLKKSVTDILKSVAGQIGYPLVSKVDALKYDKFVINQATGYEVLQKIQEQFRIMIYMYDGKLWANYFFMERNGVEYIELSKNVKAANLQYVSETDVKVRVNIKGVGADNKSTKQITVGEKGGEVVNLPDRLNVTDEKALENIAKEELKRLSYTGYRGDVTLWGRPFVGLAWVVNVRDPDYAGRDGFYFVKAVKVSFNIQGYERNLTLAERLD
jgi:phage protein D